MSKTDFYSNIFFTDFGTVEFHTQKGFVKMSQSDFYSLLRREQRNLKIEKEEILTIQRNTAQVIKYLNTKSNELISL